MEKNKGIYKSSAKELCSTKTPKTNNEYIKDFTLTQEGKYNTFVGAIIRLNDMPKKYT